MSKSSFILVLFCIMYAGDIQSSARGPKSNSASIPFDLYDDKFKKLKGIKDDDFIKGMINKDFEAEIQKQVSELSPTALQNLKKEAQSQTVKNMAERVFNQKKSQQLGSDSVTNKTSAASNFFNKINNSNVLNKKSAPSSSLVNINAATAASSSMREDSFSFKADYDDLKKIIQDYENNDGKTQRADKVLIEKVSLFKEKISDPSKVYVQDIKQDIAKRGVQLESQADKLLEQMEKHFLEINKSSQDLLDATGWGWGAVDEEKRNNSISSLSGLVTQLYGNYTELRKLALTQAQPVVDANEVQALKIAQLAESTKKYVDEIKKEFDDLSQKINRNIPSMTDGDQFMKPRLEFLAFKKQFLLPVQALLKKIDELAGQAIVLPEEIRKNDGNQLRRDELEGELYKKLDSAQSAEIKAKELLEESKQEIAKFLITLDSTPKSNEKAKAALVVSEGKQALAAGNYKKFGQAMNKQYHNFLGIYSGFNNAIWNSVGIQKSKMLPVYASYIPRLLSTTSSLVDNIDSASKMDVSTLSGADRQELVIHTSKLNMAVSVVSLQTAIGATRIPLLSDKKKESLAIIPTLKTSSSDQVTISNILMRLGKANQKLLQMVPSTEKTAVISAAVEPLFTDPNYRNLFYPITVQSFIKSELETELGAALSAVTNFSEGMIIPAAATDSILRNATDVIALVQKHEIKEISVKVDQLLASIQEEKLFKTGDINEVALISNVDLLHKLDTILLASFVTEMKASLYEIGKKPIDILNSDFDTKLELYQDVNPDAYKLLGSRNYIMNIIFDIIDVKLDLLALLANNFDALQSESKQLTLEAAIAAQQTQLLVSSPSLLGNLTSSSSALVKSSSRMQKVSEDIFSEVVGLPKGSLTMPSAADSLNMMQLALQEAVVADQTVKLKKRLQQIVPQGQTSESTRQEKIIQNLLPKVKEKEHRVLPEKQTESSAMQAKSLPAGTDQKEINKIDHRLAAKIDTFAQGEKDISGSLQDPVLQGQITKLANDEKIIRSLLLKLEKKELIILEEMQTEFRAMQTKSLAAGTDQKETDKIDHTLAAKIDTFTQDKKYVSQLFRPLTKKFMDEVEKNAPYWFNKLQNKTNMIELKDVEKIVAYRNYDKGQVLYINGYLQVMVF